MRRTLWFGVVCVLGAAAINACGGSDTGGSTEGTSDTGSGGSGGGGGGGTTTTTSSSSSTTSSSSSSSTTSSSSSSGSTSSSSSSSSSGGTMVNGCDPATAEDHTADSSVTIMFPVGGLKYSPACIKIAKGSSVTFSGSFMNHPLSGGTSGTPDASSPITHTMTGTSADFTFSEAGTFPYYCDFHFSSGMEGAIFVE